MLTNATVIKGVLGFVQHTYIQLQDVLQHDVVVVDHNLINYQISYPVDYVIQS